MKRAARAKGSLPEMSTPVQKDSQITALLIAPNRDLAQQFVATLPQTRAFQILADLKSYPPAQTLEMRVAAVEAQRDPAGSGFRLGGGHRAHPVYRRIETRRCRWWDCTRITIRTRFCNRCAPAPPSFWRRPFELASQRDAIARLRRLCGPETPAGKRSRACDRIFERQTGLRRLHAGDANGFRAAPLDRASGSCWRTSI